MSRRPGSLERFMEVNRIPASRVDIPRLCRSFRQEMTSGLDGRPSSLPMIPTFIETSREVPRGEKVIALDAGGTNFRVAVVSFDASGRPVIEDLARHRMPGVDEELSKEEFFRMMAGFVLPYAGRADRIGFCFSYAVEMMPDKDGKLLHFSKEIKAPEVTGQIIGASLRLALAQGGFRDPPRIVLLNDTVATLLTGRNALPGRRFDGFIGLVCGTGINAAYVESNANIGKIPGLDPSGSQIINTESGSFGGTFGKVDDEYDSTTTVPGKYRHEKAISGAYLSALCLFTAQRAARAGCLSAEAERELEKVPSLSGRELNDFLLYPDGDNPLGAVCGRVPAEDARALYRLCDALVERAAALVAMNLCALVLKTDRGQDPRYPICITADGTTFWQLRSFRMRVESHMRGFLAGKNERAWEITSVDDAPLLGAAIAALTN
ncbi:MAG TPA: hexokinase [Spirochaetia bacterium]|nr:hexokinase [Spirochaetia bacterium]